MSKAIAALRERLGAPRDVVGLAVFRILFGGLMCISTVRFLANGWVEQFYAGPSFFFHYWGFEWIAPLDVWGMRAVYVALAVAAFGVSIGLFYRVSVVAFAGLFAYVQLCDLSNYLNHYYLVTILAVLLAFLPAHGAYSIDAWRRPQLRRASVPAWVIYLLRFQVGVVYFYAGIAKCQPDWLFHGQPLGIWLAARTETPLLGPLFAIPQSAIVLSWAGFLFDTTIAFWLSWRRARPYAFLVLLAFHVCTHLMFTIGVFPFLMTICATLFFEPDWPRRLVARLQRAFGRATKPLGSTGVAPARLVPTPLIVGLLLWACVQVLVPARTFALYGGDVLWHEQGMRYSWRVMVREKTGSIAYRVRAAGFTRERIVPPRQYLTGHQEREMSGQPDMILQLAHHIRDDFRARGYRDVEVRVDALASLNGRRAARLIDPNVDLAGVEDGIGFARWILPSPTEQPLAIADGTR